jgi:hypothetical protein
MCERSSVLGTMHSCATVQKECCVISYVFGRNPVIVTFLSEVRFPTTQTQKYCTGYSCIVTLNLLSDD